MGWFRLLQPSDRRQETRDRRLETATSDVWSLISGLLSPVLVLGSRSPGNDQEYTTRSFTHRSRSIHCPFIVEEIVYARTDACAARPAAGHPRRRRGRGVPIAQTPGPAGLPGGRAAPQPQPRYPARPALARGG